MSERKTFESIERQKDVWTEGLIEHPGIGSYGAEWGDIYSTSARNKRGDILGNYHHILNELLIPNINDKHVVDLGCLDGKWVIPMTWYAKKITAVDIITAGFEKISGWPGFRREQIVFYRTQGYELHGIITGSVDYIFCMDVFARTEPEVIELYMEEFKRVLSPQGKACIHLPCQIKQLSHELGFTPLSVEWISATTKKHFENFIIDYQTINHGILLLVNY